MFNSRMAIALIACLLLPLTGCRSTYYGMMETFGYEKRDILVNRVVDARDAQSSASEQFKTTLERFSEVANFDGGELQQKYSNLQRELNRSESRAKAVSDRIVAVERVADDLFREWAEEIKQFSNPDLRATSEQQRRDTQLRYVRLLDAMKAAESRMEPVLVTFRDYVLALKHSLNAQAIGALEGVATQLDSDVTRLIEEMQKSIDEADEFLRSMQGT